MKIKFYGDHSKLHCGCQAVTMYIYSILKEYKIIKDVDSVDYDVLIVNGEGSMHHDSVDFYKKIKLIKNAQDNGKKTYLINTVWQNNSNKFDEILKKIDKIIVRDILSKKELEKVHNIKSDLFLDFSYFSEIKENSSYLDLNGKYAITDFYSYQFNDWVKYTYKRDREYLDMSLLNWSQFVKTLETSNLLITGRHHAVYAACKAKTPFVALESNTHKISGFIKNTPFPIPVCYTPKDFESTIIWANKNKSMYSEFFDFLDEMPKFNSKDIGL